jgi:hypothetical protein
MSKQPVFTQMKKELVPVLEELRRLEPIFHTPEFGTTLAEFERRMAPDYFEVGASGRRYSRAFIEATLVQASLVDAAAKAGSAQSLGCGNWATIRFRSPTH